MVRIDPRPDIDDLRKEFQKYWFDKLDDARDAILARIQAWDIFSPKALVTKQTDEDRREGEVRRIINELLMLFDYQVDQDEILETYRGYLEATYLRGTDVSDDFPYYQHRFGEPDYDSLRFLSDQGPAIFKTYFADMGQRLRNAMLQSMGLGEVRQVLMRRIRDTFNMSKYRADTIVRTELARAAMEGRLNAYEQNPEADLVEWYYARTGKRCSRVPECSRMDGEVYKVEDAHGLIPAHPRCECTFRPVTKTQAARNAFEKNAVNMGMHSDDVDEMMYAFLALPTSIRSPMMDDLISGQLKLVLAGGSYEQQAKMTGGFDGWAGLYSNTVAHQPIPLEGMVGLKHGGGQDIIVVNGGHGVDSMTGTFMHEMSHYINTSLYARVALGASPERLKYYSTIASSDKVRDLWTGFLILPRDKKWIDPRNADRNSSEFFAEAFKELFIRPYWMKQSIQEKHPGVWEFMMGIFEHFEAAAAGG